jgi:hypothetical protein
MCVCVTSQFLLLTLQTNKQINAATSFTRNIRRDRVVHILAHMHLCNLIIYGEGGLIVLCGCFI